MNNLSSFFGKIFKKISEDEKIRNEILCILKEKTKNNFDEDSIQIKEGVVYVKAHPMI